MDYIIHALGMPFNGDTIKTKSLGGSESAAYYLARELAARGHRVTMFTNDKDGGDFDGVRYVWAGQISEQAPLGQQFEFYAGNTPHDVLIIQRHPIAFAKRFASKITLWQTHDLALHRTAGMVQSMLWNTSAVTVVSEWHKAQVRDVYGIAEDSIYVVPNGVDAALYSGAIDPLIPLNDAGQQARITGMKLLYQSRPERGLEHLVRPGGIMERLKGVATLFVCGYDNTTAEMAPYYEQLAAWGNALPNVLHLGALTKDRLADLQRSCDALIYPTEFCEVSCITAMEAMHAGLPMITSRQAALPETCKGSGTILIDLKGGVADEDAFVAEVKRFAQSSGLRKSLQVDQKLAATTRTWAVATNALERAVHGCMNKRSDTAMLRHWMKLGDIPAVRSRIDEAPSNAITEAIRHELSLYSFLDSEDAYDAHYEKHGGRYYADTTKEERRQPLGGARWEGVKSLVAAAIEKKGGPINVLDYGCAHGHYTIALAKLFPMCHFHGIDISAAAIRDAVEWLQVEGLPNVSFTRADGLKSPETYDVVILAEVLEHVRDYRALLEAARAHLRDGGCLITTTPYGPWEWIGHEAYKKAREHWQHFDRADLTEIFHGMDPEIICAPGGSAPCGTPIGSWCCRVYPGDKSFGIVDMERKYREAMPEQTVSACLIAKDAQNTIRKTLDSLVPWVSEVIVGIDSTDGGETEGVLKAFKRANPWLPVQWFYGPSPLEVGFGEARNAVVDRACGDWILWIDSDEELIGGHEIPKLLRPNPHPAYGAAQIHFSVQPAQVLTTDFPSRLFRANRGIRFYGMVHEHPETRPGEAIPNATIRSEFQFAHNGYVTEDVRRRRYQRNLPLLMRDIEAHPDRILNKFLLIRDIAQGVGFELQHNGGMVQPDHRVRAGQVIDLWRGMLASDKPVSRMLLDSMQYYTLAAEVIGGWFNVDTTLNVQKLSVESKVRVQAKFLTADDFTGLVNRLSKEATQTYDSAYF